MVTMDDANSGEHDEPFVDRTTTGTPHEMVNDDEASDDDASETEEHENNESEEVTEFASKSTSNHPADHYPRPFPFAFAPAAVAPSYYQQQPPVLLCDPAIILADGSASRRSRGGVTEPFPEKLHRMLYACERENLSDVASFFPHGRAFAIHKSRRFVTEIMPRFFRQSKLTSFQRQLNLYGFRRLSQGRDNGGYYHPLFLKGIPRLCLNMKRIKIKGNVKASRDPDTEPNFYLYPPLEAVNRDAMPPTSNNYYPSTMPHANIPNTGTNDGPNAATLATLPPTTMKSCPPPYTALMQQQQQQQQQPRGGIGAATAYNSAGSFHFYPPPPVLYGYPPWYPPHSSITYYPPPPPPRTVTMQHSPMVVMAAAATAPPAVVTANNINTVVVATTPEQAREGADNRASGHGGSTSPMVALALEE